MKAKTVTWDSADNAIPMARRSSDEVCLVTGGAGFIGSYLVRELVRQGKQVVVYDFTTDTSYIADCVDRVEFVYGDVADKVHLKAVMAEHGVQVVFHLAYMLVPDTAERLETAIQVNCAGFQNVMEAARILDVRRVIWPSSQTVYGLAEFHPEGPLTEDVCLRPTTLYGACKLFNEHVARHYREVYDVDNIGFRKSVVWGLGKSRRRDLSISHLLIENALLGRPIEMPAVDYHANYVYIKDVVRAYLLAAQAPKTEHLIFNIGGHVYKNSELVELLQQLVPEVTGRTTKVCVHHREAQDIPNPVDAYAQDLSRSKAELGYEPAYTIEDGLQDYLKVKEKLGKQYQSSWLET